MIALLAVLVSGVLLNAMDVPMPKYHLAFIASDGLLIGEATTDKDGKFSVTIPPGTYKVLIGTDGTVQSVTVDKSTSKLELHRHAPAPTPEPHVIEIIQGTQRSVLRLPLEPGAPVAPVIRPLNAPPPVIEAPKPELHIYFDVPPVITEPRGPRQHGDFNLPLGPPPA